MKTLNEQKSAVLAKLQAGTVNLEFIKANGELRLMEATLTGSDIEGFGNGDTSATVWDKGANGWRRFSWSGLSKVDGEIFDYAD